MKNAKVIEIQLPVAERIKIIQCDYAHFFEDTQRIESLLAQLKRIRGIENVTKWIELLHQRKWPNLIQELLVNHYDLCYKTAGAHNSSFQKPIKTIILESSTPPSYVNAVTHL